MNKTDRKIEEQIKHIKEEHSTMGIGYHLDLLSTLIQEERKDAIEEFVKWLKNIEVSRQSADTHELLDSSIRAETMEQALYKVLPKLAKQYLESEGK